jgi:hypothetical protein
MGEPPARQAGVYHERSAKTMRLHPADPFTTRGLTFQAVLTLGAGQEEDSNV